MEWVVGALIIGGLSVFAIWACTEARRQYRDRFDDGDEQ